MPSAEAMFGGGRVTGHSVTPAPDRTDIYDKMGKLLKLPDGKLSKLPDLQRKEELKRSLGDSPAPLFREVRELILRKCAPDREKEIQEIFERQPFGELERLVTQKLLDVVKRVAKQELENENWLHLVARLSGRSYEEMRVIILEFLDPDVFNVSIENCVSFLDPLIESWGINLATFGVGIVLNRRLVPGHPTKFEFVEREPDQTSRRIRPVACKKCECTSHTKRACGHILEVDEANCPRCGAQIEPGESDR